MKSLRRILIRELVVLHAAVVVVVSLAAWFALSHWSQRQAQARVSADLRQLDRALTDRMQRMEQVGQVIAGLWAQGTLDPSRDQATWRQLAPLVGPYTTLTGVNLVRPDGQGFGLGHLPSGWAGRAIRHQAGRWVSGPVLGLPPGRAGSSSNPGAPPIDFRTRPWYRLGASLTQGQWTAPYHYIGRLEGQPGISYVLPVRTARGELIGVISLDLLLNALTQVIQELRPTPRSMVMVLDGAGRVVLTAEETLLGEAQSFLHPLRAEHRSDALGLFEGRATHPDGMALRQGWTRAYGLVRPFSGARELHWQLLVTIPTADLLSDPLLRALIVVGIGVMVTAILAWRVVRLGQRFAGPLSSLELATGGLGQPGELALPTSDIREILRLSEALQNAHTALQERDALQEHLRQHQKLETVGTLAGGIAHDVNNQLTAILGQISLGRERLSSGQDPDANLQRAEEATRRCAETTRALLSFSRPARSERVALDLNAVVREAAMLLKRGLGPSIRLELALSPSLLPVLGDAVQLEQVLMNLGMNARDAMPAGGLLRLGTAPLGTGEVLMWVEDNGIGMRPEVQSRMFDPFFTTKPVGQGSGLGLSMVHGIAQAHGATLEVDSEWGRGTTFRLRLPAATTPSAEAVQVAAPPRGAWLKGRRILVVEDEPGIRQVLQAALETAGARCETADDGEAGWTAWQTGHWDLVLTDHHMPRLTGLELLDRLRQAGAEVPVILASGRGLEGIEDRAERDPHLIFLPKPFHLDGLLLAVQELLGG